jgi:hypothetical protein
MIEKGPPIPKITNSGLGQINTYNHHGQTSKQTNKQANKQTNKQTNNQRSIALEEHL